MASTTETPQNTSEDEETQKDVQPPEDPPPAVEDSLSREPSISEILQKYEKMFAHRFTAEDEEYQKYVQRPAAKPPLIQDWRSRSGGNQRYRDRFRDNRQYKGRGDRYDRQGGYRSNQWQDRGWGNSYSQRRQGQMSFSQHGRQSHYGYGSYSQGYY
ncbi:RNA guanine-N7 methyltransferase activating subunit [Anolis sagrei]|uniref:RNA guanine-N7 methyltransferase activating subunit n=1 Tax=Anolis sagrei TaxID=38937 RepID=UPI003520F270